MRECSPLEKMSGFGTLILELLTEGKTCQFLAHVRFAAVRCDTPTGGPNSHVTGGATEFVFTDVVTYACNNGYVTDGGDETRTCEADRTWSGSPLSCTCRYTALPIKSAFLLSYESFIPWVIMCMFNLCAYLKFFKAT